METQTTLRRSFGSHTMSQSGAVTFASDAAKRRSQKCSALGIRLRARSTHRRTCSRSATPATRPIAGHPSALPRQPQDDVLYLSRGPRRWFRLSRHLASPTCLRKRRNNDVGTSLRGRRARFPSQKKRSLYRDRRLQHYFHQGRVNDKLPAHARNRALKRSGLSNKPVRRIFIASDL